MRIWEDWVKLVKSSVLNLLAWVNVFSVKVYNGGRIVPARVRESDWSDRNCARNS